MSKNVVKHNHKLKRHYYSNGTAVYFCTLDCDYKISPALALGKVVICWRCGKAFPMNAYSITLAKPHCEECHTFKNEKNKQESKRRRATDEKIHTSISASIADEVTSSLKDRLGSAVVYKELPPEKEEEML